MLLNLLGGIAQTPKKGDSIILVFSHLKTLYSSGIST